MRSPPLKGTRPSGVMGKNKARSLQYSWFLKKDHSEVKLSSLFLCGDMMPDCTYLRRRNVYWCLQVCKQQYTFVWSSFWCSYCRARQNSECKNWLTCNPRLIWIELAVHHRKLPWTVSMNTKLWFGIYWIAFKEIQHRKWHSIHLFLYPFIHLQDPVTSKLKTFNRARFKANFRTNI